MIDPDQRVPVREKAGLGVGEYASSLVWQTLMYFLPIFYTDTFGITAASATLMFLVVRSIDAFTDPMMGMIADRTSTRWGKYRPYFLWMAVPYGVCAVLMFTTPEFSEGGKLAYAYITYSLMMLVYTAIMIPHNCVLGVMSKDPEERTSISSYKFVFAYAAGFTVQLFMIPMVAKLGEGDPSKGYQLAMMLLGGISVFCFLVSFATVRERVQPPAQTKSRIREDLGDLVRNRPWLIMFLFSLAQLVFIVIRSSDTAYYFKYYIGDEAAAGPFMATGTACVLLGVFPTKWLAKRFGKRTLMIACTVIVVFTTALFYLARPDDIVLLYALQIISSLAAGPVFPLIWSMLADVADYSEWKHGRRATALVFSATSFAFKAGVSLGGAIIMGALTWFGFEANVEQTPQAMMGIRMGMSLLPASFAFVSLALLWFYPLTDRRVDEIAAALKARAGEADPEPAS